MTFKLIAVDLDGTLLGGTEGKYGCLPDGLEALRQATSNQVMIAIVTGRGINYTLDLLKREKINVKRERWPHFIIADDYQLYHLRNGTFHPDLVWNEELHRYELQYFSHIRAEVDMLIINELAHLDVPIERRNDEIEKQRGYVEVKFPNEDFAQEGMKVFAAWLTREKLPYSAIRVRRYVFIRHSSIGKGNTLIKLCNDLHIMPSKVLAIGDSGNDISMLDGRFGFVGACPGNAEDDIKESVYIQNGYVADGYYGNGVAEIIKHMAGS